MRHVGSIAARELRSLFSTPIAYGVLGAYLLFTGFIFAASLEAFWDAVEQVRMSGQPQYLETYSVNVHVIGGAFWTTSIILVFVVPLLSMRAFSEERANATSMVVGHEEVQSIQAGTKKPKQIEVLFKFNLTIVVTGHRANPDDVEATAVKAT